MLALIFIFNFGWLCHCDIFYGVPFLIFATKILMQSQVNHLVDHMIRKYSATYGGSWHMSFLEFVLSSQSEPSHSETIKKAINIRL